MVIRMLSTIICAHLFRMPENKRYFAGPEKGALLEIWALNLRGLPAGGKGYMPVANPPSVHDKSPRVKAFTDFYGWGFLKDSTLFPQTLTGRNI